MIKFVYRLRFLIFLFFCATLFGQINIPLVTVDDPNNPADSRNGCGAVPYVYQLGKFDITVEQYCAFLNAVAKHSDPFHLYDEALMAQDPSVREIKRRQFWWYYKYESIAGREQLPMVGIDLCRAIRFCNWLENGQPSGYEDNKTTESGSYSIENGELFSQEKDARWVLMTKDEWYKAAYYDKSDPTAYWNYATQRNEEPGNSIDPNDNQADSLQKNVNYCIDGKPALPLFPNSTDADLTAIGLFASSPGPFDSYDMTGNASQLAASMVDEEIRIFNLGGSRYHGMSQDGVIMNDPIDARSNGAQEGFNVAGDLATSHRGFRVVRIDPQYVTPQLRKLLLFAKPQE